MMSEPLPIILCGKTAEVAKSVKKGLEPEVEVIHAIFSVSSFNIGIPPLLAGIAPPASDNVGSQNYSQRPVAIVTVAQYDDAMIEKMQQACRDVGQDDIPFLRPDRSTPMPPVGPKYAQMMVRRVKTCLGELEEEGRLKGSGVYYY